MSIADKLETIELGLDLLRVADAVEPGLTKTRGTNTIKVDQS